MSSSPEPKALFGLVRPGEDVLEADKICIMSQSRANESNAWFAARDCDLRYVFIREDEPVIHNDDLSLSSVDLNKTTHENTTQHDIDTDSRSHQRKNSGVQP